MYAYSYEPNVCQFVSVYVNMYLSGRVQSISLGDVSVSMAFENKLLLVNHCINRQKGTSYTWTSFFFFNEI